MTELERRREDRRMDPEAWSAEHRKQVKFVYGMAVGGLLVFAGIVILIYAVSGDHTEKTVLGLGGGMILMGLVAGLPGTFMPVFSAILKRLPFGHSEKNGSITRALPKIEGEDEG